MSLKIEPTEDWQKVLADVLEAACVKTTPQVQAALLSIQVPIQNGVNDAWTMVLSQIRSRNEEWAGIPAPTLDALRQVREEAYKRGFEEGRRSGLHDAKRVIDQRLRQAIVEAHDTANLKRERILRQAWEIACAEIP